MTAFLQRLRNRLILWLIGDNCVVVNACIRGDVDYVGPGYPCDVLCVNLQVLNPSDCVSLSEVVNTPPDERPTLH